ncbi:MAG: helix-turn-helix domain-containing protein [Bacteroidota bacterium]
MHRYKQKKHLYDLLLGLLLLITAYHRTSFTIGFMDWYDTYRNTKINYYLVNMTLAIGPLIYLYVKSLIEPQFRFLKRDLWHFLLPVLYFFYSIVIYVYDISQPGFWDVQNGVLYLKLNMQLLPPVFTGLEYTSYLLYFTFTIQLFLKHKHHLQEYFSNTYQIELNWIRNFLIVYIFLTAYRFIQEIVGLYTKLSWIDQWWIHLFSAIALVYLGINGYFKDLSKLRALPQLGKREGIKSNTSGPSIIKKDQLDDFMEKEQPYLNPNLTLPELANQLSLSVHDLSEIVNQLYHKNFNDFINSYRVKEVKERMVDPANGHLSLLGIAIECGFNSKSTFNRVFKRSVGQSPTEYLTSHKNGMS